MQFGAVTMSQVHCRRNGLISRWSLQTKMIDRTLLLQCTAFCDWIALGANTWSVALLTQKCWVQARRTDSSDSKTFGLLAHPARRQRLARSGQKRTWEHAQKLLAGPKNLWVDLGTVKVKSCPERKFCFSKITFCWSSYPVRCNITLSQPTSRFVGSINNFFPCRDMAGGLRLRAKHSTGVLLDIFRPERRSGSIAVPNLFWNTKQNKKNNPIDSAASRVRSCNLWEKKTWQV